MDIPIFNLSHNDPEIRRQVRGIVGKPYGFWENLRQGGNGSPPLFYQEGYPEIDEMMGRFSARTRFNLEVLPAGLILRAHVNTSVYGLPIARELIRTIQIRHEAQAVDGWAGEWWLETNGGTRLRFRIKELDQLKLMAFFRKPWFEGMVTGLPVSK